MNHQIKSDDTALSALESYLRNQNKFRETSLDEYADDAKTQPAEKKDSLELILDAKNLTPPISAIVFDESPVKSYHLNAVVLGMILIDAHERKVPIAEAYAEAPSGTGAEYIASCAEAEGKTYQNLFRYDPDNPSRIYPAESLAAWMSERLSDWGYSPVNTELRD